MLMLLTAGAMPLPACARSPYDVKVRRLALAMGTGCTSDDDACLHSLIKEHRSDLEQARLHGNLSEALRALGLARGGVARAAELLEVLPRFDETTGKPLNAAAASLLKADSTSSGAQRIDQVAEVRIAPGTWKYVLLQAHDAFGGKRILVRNTANLQYHAEMAHEAKKELHGLQKVDVLGGGRIAFEGSPKKISVWGYSKTFGRCEPCNKQAAELIRRSDAYGQFPVTWSNEGY